VYRNTLMLLLLLLTGPDHLLGPPRRGLAAAAAAAAAVLVMLVALLDALSAGSGDFDISWMYGLAKGAAATLAAAFVARYGVARTPDTAVAAA
jgi:hypothetical protein